MTEVELPLSHVHVPPDVSTDGPAGAVFVLHGRGADEQDLLPVAKELPDHLHVISFRAPKQLGPGYTWYAIDASDGLHNSQPDPDDFRAALDVLEDAIDQAVTGYDLDPDAIGLLGFSQGAIGALALLTEAPTDYAWVVALHGYLPESHADHTPDGIAGTPVFLGAGTADQIIPATRAESAATKLEAWGCAVTFHTYPTGHGIGRDELADVVSFVTDYSE